MEDKKEILQKLIYTQDWFFMLKEGDEYKEGLESFIELYHLYNEIKDEISKSDQIYHAVLQDIISRQQPEYYNNIINVFDL